MDPLPESFTKVSDCVAMMARSGSISNEDLLELYAYYKQTTCGPCTGSRPGVLNIAARSRYDAWKALGELAPAEAANRYINKFLTLDGVAEEAAAVAMAEPAVQPAAATPAHPTATPTTHLSGFGVTVSTPQTDAAEQPTGADVWDLVKAGRVAELRALGAAAADWNAVDADGMSLLHWAADRGHRDTVELLLARGASVDARDADGQTPLHYAASCGHVNVARKLLDAGADSAARDDDGLTPADGAADADDDAVGATLRR